jgi:hypothetical protein
MVYYGKGFTWSEIYNMPIWLRKFYYKKIEEAIKAKQKATEKNKKTTTPRVVKPSIGPKK